MGELSPSASSSSAIGCLEDAIATDRLRATAAAHQLLVKAGRIRDAAPEVPSLEKLEHEVSAFPASVLAFGLAPSGVGSVLFNMLHNFRADRLAKRAQDTLRRQGETSRASILLVFGRQPTRIVSPRVVRIRGTTCRFILDSSRRWSPCRVNSWIALAAAAPIQFQASGATAADIQGTVDAFRAAIGDPNNGNAAGPLAGGRREINWDGGGAIASSFTTDPILTVFQNSRGATFTTPDARLPAGG